MLEVGGYYKTRDGVKVYCLAILPDELKYDTGDNYVCVLYDKGRRYGHLVYYFENGNAMAAEYEADEKYDHDIVGEWWEQ